MSATRLIRIFQKYILSTLLIVMGVVVVVTSIELVIGVVRAILDPPLLLTTSELTRIGALFLTVLITVELFGILEVMLLENVVHVEFVVAVALIAAAREVLLVEFTSVAPLKLVGLATLILALGVGYYLIKRTGSPETDPSQSRRRDWTRKTTPPPNSSRWGYWSLPTIRHCQAQKGLHQIWCSSHTF